MFKFGCHSIKAKHLPNPLRDLASRPKTVRTNDRALLVFQETFREPEYVVAEPDGENEHDAAPRDVADEGEERFQNVFSVVVQVLEDNDIVWRWWIHVWRVFDLFGHFWLLMVR